MSVNFPIEGRLTMEQEHVSHILNFWFEAIDLDTQLTKEHPTVKRWFSKNKKTDEYIVKEFKADLLNAQTGDYNSWAQTTEGGLALMILFDQFSRNIYRDSAKAFENDLKALELSLRSIKDGFDERLELYERIFIYMPLMHSELLEIQEESVKYFGKIVEYAKTWEDPSLEYYQYTFEYAQRHHDIIKQFGRFPHRNKVLKRRSTSDETTFLGQTGSSF